MKLKFLALLLTGAVAFCALPSHAQAFAGKHHKHKHHRHHHHKK